MPGALGQWFASGLVSAPAAGAVLVDTGPLSTGVYRCTVTVSASVAAVVDVERRNAANDTTISMQRIYVMATTVVPDFDLEDAFANQERLRVTNVTLIMAGTVSASIVARQTSSG